jgi:hypothetical protein
MPRRLFAVSIVARLPVPMLSIGLLVHTQRLTGSFAAAGVVTAVFAGALGAGGPLLARAADRRGQTGVLLASGLVAGLALVGAAVLPVGASPSLLVAVAAVLGLSVPPVGACLRALLPGLVADAPAAYAAEATASELTFIAGPPLVLLAGALWSTGVALAGAGMLLVAGTVAFALQGPSRAWRGQAAARRPRGGSLADPGVRTLVAVLVAVGVVFGAVEVGVAAAASGAAGPLLGLWGAGSLVGGMVAARSRGVRLELLLVALAAGHLALASVAGSVVALAFVLVLAGATIAPTYASVYALVERVAPAGTVTEAFAWLSTAVAIGAAVGAALAGSVAESAGPAATFLVAGAAGLVGVAIGALRVATLRLA